MKIDSCDYSYITVCDTNSVFNCIWYLDGVKVILEPPVSIKAWYQVQTSFRNVVIIEHNATAVIIDLYWFWLVLLFSRKRQHFYTVYLKTYNCILFTNFQHSKLYSFQNRSLGLILKIFLTYNFSLDILLKQILTKNSCN